MQRTAIPVSTTCNRPDVDNAITTLIGDLVAAGMPVRQATEAAARRAAADAIARRWRADLVDFVVIRAVDLGSRFARAA